jgi:hypothetical protein
MLGKLPNKTREATLITGIGVLCFVVSREATLITGIKTPKHKASG